MKEPKDARSTGRKRGRKVLQQSGISYECSCDGSRHDKISSCGAQKGNEICGWSPEEQSRSSTLDVNHKNKNILDNDPANLEWLCRPCHRAIDRRTEKGVEHEEETYKRVDKSFLESFGL